MDGQGIGDEYRIGGKVDELYLDGWTKKEGQGEKREGGMKKGVGKRRRKAIGQIMGYYHYCCVLTPTRTTARSRES